MDRFVQTGHQDSPHYPLIVNNAGWVALSSASGERASGPNPGKTKAPPACLRQAGRLPVCVARRQAAGSRSRSAKRNHPV